MDLDMRSESNVFVAVYMITYNHEAYIEQAVVSILSQDTKFNYKLFIGEDCSTDRTATICKKLKEKYTDKIELIIHSENVGPNRNALSIYKACFESGASYIAMCEGDDYWTDPNKLQKQVDFLEANEEYVLCFHKVKILKPDGALVDDYITKVPENYETYETLARLGNYIHTPTVVFRNILTEFPFEYNLSPIGDYFLYMMLSEQGKLKYIEEEMAVYRYGVGIFSNKGKIQMAKANFKLFTLLLSYSGSPKINQILLDRQLTAFDHLEHMVRSEYAEAFVSHHVFFKALKSIRTPHKFWKKVRNKFR